VKKHTLALAAAATLAVFPFSNAMAQKAGDLVMSVGWIGIHLNDSSSPDEVTSPISFSIPYSGVKVNDANTLGVTADYFVTDHVAVEGLAGIPPSFRVQGTGTAGLLGEIGSTTIWSPMVFAKYYFLNSNATLRPFVGLGVGYFWFTKVNMLGGIPSAIATTESELSSSVAPVFSVGGSWKFTKHWSAVGTLMHIPLKTTATLHTTVPALGMTIHHQVRLTLNPTVSYLGLAYTF
jgi:outer membrane protein